MAPLEDRGVNHSETDELAAVRDWIVAKHSWAVDLDLDTDLIENRLIDSLEFAEFLFTLEEITGNAIDLAEVDLEAFRSLRKIQSHFLRRFRGDVR